MNLISCVGFLFFLGCLTSSIPVFSGNTKVLENHYLKREVTIKAGTLKTLSLTNKLSNQQLIPIGCEEFALRISKNADLEGSDIFLKSNDFTVTNFSGNNNEIVASLENSQYQIKVIVHYTLKPNEFYSHKYLEITANERWIMELIDVESLAFSDAFQPYKAKDMMWTTNKFLPALGQPVYTSKSSTFWGLEFPASWNRVEDNYIRCGFQGAVELKPNQKYTTYQSVFGVSDKPEFIKDAFLAYIDQLRAVPFGLHIQYNTWFDFGGSVSQKKFLESLETLHNELVVKRGCKPLDVYVIDDAWQNSRPPRSPLEDWSKGMYGVNTANFDEGMITVRREIEKKGSKMGLWASPACLFGASSNLDVLESNGFETLVGGIQGKNGKVAKSMSMVGDKYMSLLEEALLRMVKMGAVYFKMDGIFGHLGMRFFEVTPNRGTPVLSYLMPKDILANDSRLNDSKFDEMKRYYITRGTDRLIGIYRKMREINPEVRILNHNGATISPWWFMTIDVLSLVNMQDGAQGESDRNAQMCYRDGVYYQTVVVDNNQIPINSIFNHEPAKDGSRFEDADIQKFRNYFFMAISRGSSMVELYVQTRSLSMEEFDVIADGLKWLYKAYPAFKNSRMFGNNPLGTHTFKEQNVSLKDIDLNTEAKIYGYTGWTKDRGYVSIHNPSATKSTYNFKLDRASGLEPGSVTFKLSSPMPDKIHGLKKNWQYGETITIEVGPKEVIILDFET